MASNPRAAKVKPATHRAAVMEAAFAYGGREPRRAAKVETPEKVRPKRCPWCPTGVAVVQHQGFSDEDGVPHSRGHYVRCTTAFCEARGPLRSTAEVARRDWNRGVVTASKYRAAVKEARRRKR